MTPYCYQAIIFMSHTCYRSASWGNLHQSSAENVGKVWELSTRVSSLESEVRKRERKFNILTAYIV